MFSRFLKLDKGKQDRILNGAMREFAQKGYDNASTNEIVKKSGISKGLLFHYFQNKKRLFLFLYEHCVAILLNELYEKIDTGEKDIIMRLRRITVYKLELLKKYPEIINFLQAAYLEKSGDVKRELDDITSRMNRNSMGRVFQDIDTSMFADGISIDKVINIISWTFEGLGNEELKKARMLGVDMEYEKVFAEADAYMEIFKKCFYKDVGRV